MSALDIKEELLRKIREQRGASADAVTPTPEPEIVATPDPLVCKTSYNDVFTVPCESVGLVNFSLDSYLESLPTWNHEQASMIPKVDPHYVEQPEVLWMLTYCIVHDEIALLQGYQGTGKTSGLEYVCAKLGIPLLRINCASTQDSSSIAGAVRVINEGGVPVTKYDGDTSFIRSMASGCIALLDEIFMAPDDLRGGTLMRYSGNRVLTAPEDSGAIHGVQVHDISRLFYADNTLGLGDNADKFSSRFVADTAFLDGINFVVKVNYLKPDVEQKLLEDKVPNVNNYDPSISKKLVQLANLVRNAFHNGDLPTTMSLRTLRPIAEQASILRNPIIALRYGFFNKLSENSEKDTFKQLMNTVGFHSKYGTID
jgi:cobaltochelatase CobS